MNIPCKRGAAVLKYAKDPSIRGNANLVKYLCIFNINNWEFVQPDLRTDEIYYDMLRSRWNAPDTQQETIPPLVLQLGGAVENKERVLAAVQHSSTISCMLARTFRWTPRSWPGLGLLGRSRPLRMQRHSRSPMRVR